MGSLTGGRGRGGKTAGSRGRGGKTAGSRGRGGARAEIPPHRTFEWKGITHHLEGARKPDTELERRVFRKLRLDDSEEEAGLTAGNQVGGGQRGTFQGAGGGSKPTGGGSKPTAEIPRNDAVRTGEFGGRGRGGVTGRPGLGRGNGSTLPPPANSNGGEEKVMTVTRA